MGSERNIAPRALSLAVHELRTPITVAAGYLRMVLREQAGPVTDKQRKMLEEAERSCGRIGALIGEMSELGRLESGDVAVPAVALDLAALLTEVAGDMHEGEDRGVTLDVHAGESIMVEGDRPRLGAALKALMHAALRERAEPGPVVVRCTTIARGERSWAVVTIGDDVTRKALLEHADAPTPPPFEEWRGGMGLALPVGRRVIDAPASARQMAAAARESCDSYTWSTARERWIEVYEAALAAAGKPLRAPAAEQTA